MEPEAHGPIGEADVNAATVSIAISLKRIADTVEKVANTNSEQLGDFIEAVIKDLKGRGID